jgi:hypothetical protein
MKVAYLFTSALSHKILSIIIPQIESGRHGVDVVGMMFFIDNTYFLTKGDAIAEKLHELQKKTGMLLMACDICAYERGIEKKLIDSAKIGCFPDLYKAIIEAGGVDQVITF